ncbi:MAG: transporter substrate-binding domain-containing protein [Treponema sp.]|nr:transporter substrate-binding domain-containing protein [Treponema sp.]
MKKDVKKIISILLVLLLASSVFAKTRKIHVAHTVTNVPYDFLDEKGKADGFEIAVLKAVDELLPQYKFVFHGVSDEELLIGTEAGKYQLGSKGAWMTAERAKKFIIPSQPLAASVIGIAYRAENKDQIKDLESFARYSGKLIPISPQSAQYSVIQDYNDKHADNQIKLVPSDVFDIADSYLWVLEGRYDAYFVLKLSFEKNVLNENGPYHQFADKLAYVPYKGIPTWPLFNKKESQLAADYDKAVQELRENGTISKLSQKYFGEDVFTFVTD